MINDRAIADHIEALTLAIDDLKRRMAALENAGVIKASNQMDAHTRHLHGALQATIGERHA